MSHLSDTITSTQHPELDDSQWQYRRAWLVLIVISFRTKQHKTQLTKSAHAAGSRFFRGMNDDGVTDFHAVMFKHDKMCVVTSLCTF